MDYGSDHPRVANFTSTLASCISVVRTYSSFLMVRIASTTSTNQIKKLCDC